ncbi:MAG TPA: hypothetical protein VGD79_09430 [Thermoanaerobaculia bacterium]|jgi:hypothetical protein
MLRQLLLSLAIGVCACKPALHADRPHDPRIAAASFFTERYAHSRFAKWDIRATAAGDDCGLLLVHTTQVMDDTLVEALHYGAGNYAIVDGGVQTFMRKRGFRGVVYVDVLERSWTFGVVSEAEAPRLKPCE